MPPSVSRVQIHHAVTPDLWAMKTVLLTSLLICCTAHFAVGQFSERAVESGSVDELKGSRNIYLTAFGDQVVQKRITEVIKKKLPHLNFVSSRMTADVWLNVTFGSRYDRYRVPNANDGSAQTASDVLYTAHGKLFRVKPDRRLSLIKEFQREGPDRKTLGADFAGEFVKTYEKANTGSAPAPTVSQSQTMVTTKESTAIRQKQEEGRLAVQPQPSAVQGQPLAVEPQPLTDEIEVLKVDTNLVTINASVLDRDARYISTLSKESFSVYEEGVKQELAFFAAVEEPFTVALLIDTSGSVRRTFKDIIAAANSFVAQLRPHDNLMVVAFDSDIREVVKTTKSSMVKDRGVSLEVGGGQHTLVYDAVAFTIRQRLNHMRGRKAIILLTDGLSSDGESTYERSISDAEEAGSLVYSIQFEPFKEAMKHFMGRSRKAAPTDHKEIQEYRMHIEKAGAYLEELARKTGGRSFKADGVKDFSHAFALIVKELSSQYSLGYYPTPLPKQGDRRQIKVAVNVPNVVVRARNDYIFATSGSLPPPTSSKEK